MATIKIQDRAHEFRIEIAGRFSGRCLDEVASAWKGALADAGTRRITVDISRMTGYDSTGCKLLRKIYLHGTHFAAGTALSLVFLNEISSPARRGPALVHEAKPVAKETSAKTLPRVHTIAAGQ